jgi:hypothetical protein
MVEQGVWYRREKQERLEFNTEILLNICGIRNKQSFLFWDRTPCSLLKVNRRFGGTYHRYLQVRRRRQARIQRESMWQAG